MLLAAMQFFIMQFMVNPTYADKVPGYYVQVIHTGYDSINNLTYEVAERYDVYNDGTTHLYWMEPIPFIGKPVVDTTAFTVSHDYKPNQAAEYLANKLAQ